MLARSYLQAHKPKLSVIAINPSCGDENSEAWKASPDTNEERYKT